jgi:hypothetical protein
VSKIQKSIRILAGCGLAIAAILFVPDLAAAQDEGAQLDASKVPATASKLGGFVPAGWKIEEDVAGDLDQDGVADHVLKLIEDKPGTDKDGTAIDRSRAMVIVLTGKDGVLHKAAVSDKLLQCTGCGGAFYGVSEAPANVSISKGVIVVEQDYGSRWVTEMTFRFRYDARSSMFALIGFDFASRDRAEGGGASESTNYLTGTRITTTGKGKRTTTKTTKIAKEALSIEEVDKDKFDEAANKRLGLD